MRTSPSGNQRAVKSSVAFDDPEVLEVMALLDGPRRPRLGADISDAELEASLAAGEDSTKAASQTFNAWEAERRSSEAAASRPPRQRPAEAQCERPGVKQPGQPMRRPSISEEARALLAERLPELKVRQFEEALNTKPDQRRRHRDIPAPPSQSSPMSILPQLDIRDLEADLLRHVADPGPALREAAHHVAWSMRWITLIEGGLALRASGVPDGRMTSDEILTQTRMLREYQAILGERRLALELLLARSERAQVRAEVVREGRDGPRLRAVKAA